ncbi:hypothetical protein V8B97DRAFT_1192780 [Scleroderma yunnanense]
MIKTTCAWLSLLRLSVIAFVPGLCIPCSEYGPYPKYLGRIISEDHMFVGHHHSPVSVSGIGVRSSEHDSMLISGTIHLHQLGRFIIHTPPEPRCLLFDGL